LQNIEANVAGENEPRKIGPRRALTTGSSAAPRLSVKGGTKVPGSRRLARLAEEAALASEPDILSTEDDDAAAPDAAKTTVRDFPRASSGREDADAEGDSALAAVTAPGQRRKQRLQNAGGTQVRPVAGPARVRQRHWMLIVSLVLIVLAPLGATGWYLWERATDQFASTIGFSVHKEESSTPTDLLGGLSQLSGASSTDTDILYNYIQSQELVAAVDRELDLRALYAQNHTQDPVFSLNPGASIEDLVDYWPRVVKIIYDPGTGLIELRVLASDPDMAKTIATMIFDKSSEMINRLSAIARSDTTRYAREQLNVTIEQLKKAREATTAFRSRTQIVDPSADIQGQMGLLNTLQAQLASAYIDLDLLRGTTRDGDPRLAPAQSRIDVIQVRIDEERKKFGAGGKGPGGEDYATLVAEFERLSVDREFAEASYKAALSAYDVALAEAQRKSRYLAAHVGPTLAESAQYPQREILMLVVALFLLLSWSVLSLVYYSIRDRR